MKALKRDPEQKREWVVVVDGHPHQRKMIESIAAKKQVKVTIVMDFIHVLEYLWKAAHCLYDKNDEKTEKWVEQQALRVLRGQSDRVARGIKQSATKKKSLKTGRLLINVQATCKKTEADCVMTKHSLLASPLPVVSSKALADT